MNFFLTMIVGLVLALGASAVNSAGHKEAGNPKQSDVPQGADIASAQKAAKGKEDKGAKRREQSRGERGQDLGVEPEEIIRDSDSRADNGDSDRDNGAAEGKGSEKSQEMRQRRDERKAIKDEYRADREPGQEGRGKEGGEPAKKPWWKFWAE